jgi:hypothetical protein
MAYAMFSGKKKKKKTDSDIEWLKSFVSWDGMFWISFSLFSQFD